MFEDDPLLRPSEVAEALGVAERTIWKWVRSGELPSVRLGTSRLIRIRQSAVEAFVDSVGADDE